MEEQYDDEQEGHGGGTGSRDPEAPTLRARSPVSPGCLPAVACAVIRRAGAG